MAKVTLKLGELTCPSCLTKIEQGLKQTDGVESVKVLFNAGKVKADYDASVTTPEALADVITGLGYEVKSTKAVEA
ncbi:heavy-metal-associated domain-containing protein [Agrilactobacillus yilanensis]|uniref:Heavy-metal-associated domain-containing protein n=1 Tax=Agrilactobacillus yilanensis TaxID=2485997 RepID=A0ABW4J6U3_9LACO|nr:heavy metal-associated domain-containing protein [Agrilactobacillus yilanensis]